MQKVIILASVPESIKSFRGSLLEEFNKRNIKIFIVAPFDNHSEAFKTELEDCYDAKVIPILLKKSSVGIMSDVFYFISILKIIHKIKPSIVFSYTLKPIIFGSFGAYLMGIKNINLMITGLGYIFMKPANIRSYFISKMGLHLLWLALKVSSKVIFQNKDDLELFISKKLILNAKKSIVVNGSGVDLDYYSKSPLPASTVFLMISRLIRSKGIIEYFEAAKIIKRSFPSTRFIFVGGRESNEDSIPEAVFKAYLDQNFIEYWGHISDVREAIKVCSVYCLPSYREGTPRSVLEAMAMGRPIITTDTAGCRETVNGANGILIPVKDISALANAMKKFINNNMLVERMGFESRKYAEERYCAKDVANTTADFIVNNEQ
jgi:glycosyltransferase involved in cell wall biosynthesis